MKIAPGCVVTIAYDVSTEEGEIVESSEISGPVSFVHGRKAILPGVDERLLGMKEGEERTFTLRPEEAFGRPEDAPHKVLKRSEFPADAKVARGEVFEAGIAGGHRIRLEIMDQS